MKSIKEVEKTLQECVEAIEEIKRGESGEWRPSKNEKYWFVDLDIVDVRTSYWVDGKYDNARLENKVIFKTAKEAEEYLEYLEVKNKAINEFSKEEWKDKDIDKFAYYYEVDRNKIDITAYSSYKHCISYFRSAEEAQYFINKYEKFIKREMGI